MKEKLTRFKSIRVSRNVYWWVAEELIGETTTHPKEKFKSVPLDRDKLKQLSCRVQES